MRGKILQYNGNDGTGTIVANGQQYRFTLASWVGDAVPGTGKTVEVDIADAQVRSVELVGDDVLMRERASEIGGKLGGIVGGLGGTLAKSAAERAGTGATPGTLTARYGTPLLIAYAVFLFGTTVFKALTIPMLGVGWTLFDMAGFLSQLGGGGGVKMLLIFSYLSIGVPLFWHDRRAWLALLLPLGTMGWAIVKAMSAGGRMGGGASGPGIGDFGLFGFYLPLLAALVLALQALKRFSSAA
ncbi:MAG: hypothetical protein V4503_09705 [Gemmatimonadota bacterium]